MGAQSAPPPDGTTHASGVQTITVGLPAALQELVARAATRAEDGGRIVHVASLDEARRCPAQCGGELLVLGGDALAAGAEAVAVRSEDGLPRWAVLALGEGVSPNPEVWHIPASIADPAALHWILERARLWQAARRAALRAQGDLLTIARRGNHELRSPLGCILTSVDVLREELESTMPAVHALAEPIVESANEAAGLLDRLILVARASAAAATPGEVDLGMTVWAARERLAVRAAAVEAEFIEPDTWPAAWGVREWLERIWVHLIENALQHGGPRPHIELGWRRLDGEIECFVDDQGPGVAAAARAGLFRPFHLLHERDAGRGLGLAVVQRLVELQGGRTFHQERPTGGTRFSFTIPVPPAE